MPNYTDININDIKDTHLKHLLNEYDKAYAEYRQKSAELLDKMLRLKYHSINCGGAKSTLSVVSLKGGYLTRRLSAKKALAKYGDKYHDIMAEYNALLDDTDVSTHSIAKYTLNTTLKK